MDRREESRHPAKPGGLRGLARRALDLPGGLLDLLHPPRCAICEQLLTEAEPPICPACRFGFEELATPSCPRCALPLPATDSPCATCASRPLGLDGLRCGFAYGGSLAEAIVALKFKRRRELARQLARLAFEAAGGLAEAVDGLIPVPLHRKRFIERGFDQAVLLAQELGRLSGQPVLLDRLRRVRATPPQGRRPDLQTRWLNMRRAFAVPGPQSLAGKRLCLVDDVVTSGATLSACAAALRLAGALRVTAFAAGRTLPDL